MFSQGHQRYDKNANDKIHIFFLLYETILQTFQKDQESWSLRVQLGHSCLISSLAFENAQFQVCKSYQIFLHKNLQEGTLVKMRKKGAKMDQLEFELSGS